MEYTTISTDGLRVRVRLSSFECAGAAEYHAMIEGTDPMAGAEEQYADIAEALHRLSSEVLPPGAVAVFKRWFVSDAVGHGTLLSRDPNETAALSVVGQPPLNGTKVSLWCWFMEGARTTARNDDGVTIERPAYRHLFDTGLHSNAPGEFGQTDEIFRRYTEDLVRQGLTLADNAVRTWIFVQGVDTHYADMVAARRRFFAGQGLTPDTHYIASTGIEGRHLCPDVTVFADIYAIEGLRPGQVTYLKGATHLNPTHEYGVTFERATAVDYGDRRHIFVSGTASIDNLGRIVHPLDVVAQTDRVFENIGALLAEGGTSLVDVAQMIVYLRDPADYFTVSARLDELCGDTPRIVVWAPVCRPGWLVEIECIAVREAVNSNYAPF